MPRPKTAPPAPTPRGGQPRKPAQERSRVRYEALLDATAELLAERDFNDVGLYDIAERSGVPPASTYHFFPTKEAAFTALAARYLNRLTELLNAPVEGSGLDSWVDYLRVRFERAVDYYNTHAAFARIALSGSVISEIRTLDAQFLSESADNTPFGGLARHFVLPYLPDPQLKFAVLVGIYDGVWMTSYARHGRITEEYAREGLKAGISYCRTFLPEVLPLRDPSTLTPDGQ